MARGLGSSGTIEFVGSDYPGPIIQGGEDNDIRVDVVLRYGGDQDVMDTVHVCKLDRDDGSSGIGIFVSLLPHLPVLPRLTTRLHQKQMGK